jgi:hypothetical protein
MRQRHGARRGRRGPVADLAREEPSELEPVEGIHSTMPRSSPSAVPSTVTCAPSTMPGTDRTPPKAMPQSARAVIDGEDGGRRPAPDAPLGIDHLAGDERLDPDAMSRAEEPWCPSVTGYGRRVGSPRRSRRHLGQMIKLASSPSPAGGSEVSTRQPSRCEHLGAPDVTTIHRVTMSPDARLVVSPTTANCWSCYWDCSNHRWGARLRHLVPRPVHRLTRTLRPCRTRPCP